MMNFIENIVMWITIRQMYSLIDFKNRFVSKSRESVFELRFDKLFYRRLRIYWLKLLKVYNLIKN
jgi:hypothetical protein